MTRYLLLPWRPAPLLLVAVFTAGIELALLAGLAGIAIAAILLSWFFKYCFVLLDAVIAGEEPPVLSIEMVNPVDEQRPLAQGLIIAVGCAVSAFIGAKAGRPAMIVSAALLLSALPASVAVLGLSGNPFRAASPVAISALIRGMGRDYASLVLATLGCGAGVYGLERLDAPLSLTIGVGQLAFLTLFALIGGAVHENRFALGVPTRTREERRAERERHEHATERSRMLERSFNQLRLGRSADAWSEIERWIAAHCPASARDPARTNAEYPVLIDSASRWGNPRIADRLASDYIAWLLARRENGRALEVLERRLASNPRFRPQQRAHAARLRELAAMSGNRALHRALCSDDEAAAP